MNNERKNMINLKKVGVSALAGSLAMFSAHAAEYTLSGDAEVAWGSAEGNHIDNEAANGKGIGTDMDLYFNASGELDNGWTVSFFQAMNTHAGVAATTSSQVTMGMGSLGTLRLANQFGSAANGSDDILPRAYEEVWHSASHTSIQNDFGRATAEGSVTYTLPTLEFMGVSMSLAADYDPAANVAAADASALTSNTKGVSGEAFVAKFSHDIGLTVGLGHEDINPTTAQTTGEKNTTGYIQYAAGPLTVAYQQVYRNAANRAADSEGDGYGISYTAGDMSFSYNKMEDKTKALSGVAESATAEMTSYAASYTMGAMTIAAQLWKTDNVDNTVGDDHEATEISASFAF